MSPCCYSWRAHKPPEQHYLKHYSKLPLMWSISDFPRSYHRTLICSKTWLINYTLNSQMWLSVMSLHPVGRNTRVLLCRPGNEQSTHSKCKSLVFIFTPLQNFPHRPNCFGLSDRIPYSRSSQPSNVSTFLCIILLWLQVPWLNRWELRCLLVCCSLRCRFYFNTTTLNEHP